MWDSETGQEGAGEGRKEGQDREGFGEGEAGRGEA